MREPRTSNLLASLFGSLGLPKIVIFLVLLTFIAACGGDSSDPTAIPGPTSGATSTPSSTPTSRGVAPTETPQTAAPTRFPTPAPTQVPGVPSLAGVWRTQFGGGSPVTVTLNQTRRHVEGPVTTDADLRLAAIEGDISGEVDASSEVTVAMEIFWELIAFQHEGDPVPASAWPMAVVNRGDSSHPGTVRSNLEVAYDAGNDELIGTYTVVTIVFDEDGKFTEIETGTVPIIFTRVARIAPEVKVINAKMVGANRLELSLEVDYVGEATQRDLSVTVDFRNNEETTSFSTLTVESKGIEENQGTILIEADLEEEKIPRFLHHVDLDVSAEAKETWPDTSESLTGTDTKSFERAILLPVIVTHGIIGDFAAVPVVGLGSVGPGLDMTADDLQGEGYEREGAYPTVHTLVYPSSHLLGIQWISRNSLAPKIADVLSLTYAARLDIVAHSMGGLISRYYIEGAPGLNNGDKVRKLVMVGTPNEGAAGAHTALESNGVFTPKANTILTVTKLLRIRGATGETNIGLTTSVQLLPDYSYYLEKTRKPFPEVRGYGWPTDPRMDLQKGKSGELKFNTLLSGLNSDGLDNRVDNYNVYQNNQGTVTTVRREQGRLGFWSVIKVEGPGDATVPVQSALLTDYPRASAQLNKCDGSGERVHAEMLLDPGIRNIIKEILRSPFDQAPDSCGGKTAVGIDFDIKQSFTSDPLETPLDDDQENTVGLLLVENNDDDDFDQREDNHDEIISGDISFLTGLDEKDEDKKDMATLILHRLTSSDLPSGEVSLKKLSGIGNVRIFKESDNSLILSTDGQSSSTSNEQAQVLFNTLKSGSETYLVEGINSGKLVVSIEYNGGDVEAKDEILINVVNPNFDTRIRRVDFTNNREIVRDRFEMPQQRIESIDGDAAEWKDDDCDGNTNKNWPVVYPRNSEVALNIGLCVDIKDAELDSLIATVRGVARGGGLNLVFERPGVTLIDGLNVVTGLTSPGILPDAVTFIEPLIIEWTVIVGGSSDPAGASQHNVYTTFAEPGASPLLFSAVHFATHGSLGATTEQGVVDGIWSKFTQRVSSQTTNFATPQLRRRDFDTVTGVIDTEGQALRYYNEFAPGRTLQEFFPFRGYSCTNDELLRFGEGRCGTWARFMSSVLDNHGIESNEIVLGVQFGSPVCPVIDPDPFIKLTDCVMLVNDWGFAQNGGTSGNIFYPFQWNEVVDERGVAGQSVENPYPFFWDHVIIEINIDGKATFYDPSYGIGPFETLGAYENASIAGFCRPQNLSPPRRTGPYICQVNPAGTQLTRTGE